VVVAALGTVLAVFGTATATGIHDGAKVKIVAVELFADFVRGIAKFAEVGIQKADGLVAGNLVPAEDFFLKVLYEGHIALLE
jgi:hypothetical protein